MKQKVVYVGNLQIAQTKYGQFIKGKEVNLDISKAKEVLKIKDFTIPRSLVKSKESDSVKKIYMPYPLSMMPHPLNKTKEPPPVKKHKTGHVHNPSKKGSRPFVDPSEMEGFKEIIDLRDTEKKSTIWIIGCDPNLEFYPDDFFDNKLSIAISVACVPFPRSTYFIATSNPLLDAIKRVRPDFLAKCILPLSCTRAKPLPYWEQLNPYWEDYGLDPIYMKLVKGRQVTHSSVDWRKMVRQIFKDGPVEFVQPSTSTHFGVEVAAILGAKKIVLVGCSHKSTKYFFHAHKRGMWIFFWENRPKGKQVYPASYINGRIPELATMRRDTIRFKRAFAKYGVEIVRHRFDEGRGKFVFEEIGAA